MRVLGDGNISSIYDPCYNYAGEVEDYTVNVLCIPHVDDPCDIEWISNVVLGTINNASACSGAYDDYSSSLATSAQPGATVNYTISAGGTDDQGVNIYVDYNGDGDFYDTGELVANFVRMNSYNPLDASGSFLIPLSQPAGSYRVRVITDNYYTIGSVGSCYSNYGEAEDYTLEVTNAPATWYLDADADGYYTGDPVNSAGSPGIGYVTSFIGSDDCNDVDPAVWQNGFFYYDNDGDGYTQGSPFNVCYGASIPSHYFVSPTGNDCNDFDNTKWQSGTFYIDADGDGLNVGTATVCYGATTPTGYSTTTTGGDCDDTDPLNLVTSGTPLPLSEGFEGTANPPTGWRNIDNGTQGYAWAKVATAGGFGLSSKSMMYDNYSFSVIGQKDEIQTKRLSFAGQTSVTLTFDVAYKVYTGFSDSLIVRVSTDCGNTFSKVYAKGKDGLSTSAGSCFCNFVPTATEWRTETVDLSAYAGQPSVLIQFQNRNGFGNKLYVDNVNVSGSVATCVDPIVWTGAASSDWNTADNWCGGIPTSSNNVSIVSGTPHDPVISTADANAKNITVNIGASLSITTYTLYMTGDLMVNGTLNLNSGMVSTGTNKVVIPSSGTITSSGGWVKGSLEKNVPAGSGIVATFEIGDALYYSPVTITFAHVSLSGDLTGAVTTGDHPNIGTSHLNNAKSLKSYWTFTKSNDLHFDTYNATFNWDPNDVKLDTDPTHFVIGKFDHP